MPIPIHKLNIKKNFSGNITSTHTLANKGEGGSEKVKIMLTLLMDSPLHRKQISYHFIVIFSQYYQLSLVGFLSFYFYDIDSSRQQFKNNFSSNVLR